MILFSELRGELTGEKNQHDMQNELPRWQPIPLVSVQWTQDYLTLQWHFCSQVLKVLFSVGTVVYRAEGLVCFFVLLTLLIFNA